MDAIRKPFHMNKRLQSPGKKKKKRGFLSE